MSRVVGQLHSVLRVVFSWLWKPLEMLSPMVQLVIVSAVFGVLMVFLFGRVSNQGAIRRVKNRIGAALLEVVLFRYDTLLSLRAQGELLRAGGMYFILALGPVLLLSVPFALILGHINLRLGSRPLEVGEERVLEVKVAPGTDLRKVSLAAQSGVAIVGPVRVERDRSLYWRLTPLERGVHSISIDVVGEGPVSEQIVVDGPIGQPAGIFLTRTSLLDAVLFPNGASNQTISSERINEVSLAYPEVTYDVLGLQLTWLTLFLIVSMAVGFLFSRLAGVAV